MGTVAAGRILVRIRETLTSDMCTIQSDGAGRGGCRVIKWPKRALGGRAIIDRVLLPTCETSRLRHKRIIFINLIILSKKKEKERERDSDHIHIHVHTDIHTYIRFTVFMPTFLLIAQNYYEPSLMLR